MCLRKCFIVLYRNLENTKRTMKRSKLKVNTHYLYDECQPISRVRLNTCYRGGITSHFCLLSVCRVASTHSPLAGNKNKIKQRKGSSVRPIYQYLRSKKKGKVGGPTTYKGGSMVPTGLSSR